MLIGLEVTPFLLARCLQHRDPRDLQQQKRREGGAQEPQQQLPIEGEGAGARNVQGGPHQDFPEIIGMPARRGGAVDAGRGGCGFGCGL